MAQDQRSLFANQMNMSDATHNRVKVSELRVSNYYDAKIMIILIIL